MAHTRQLIWDGWNVTVEIRDGEKYRWYSYENPNAYTDKEDRQAYAVAGALRMVSDLIRPKDAEPLPVSH